MFGVHHALVVAKTVMSIELPAGPLHNERARTDRCFGASPAFAEDSNRTPGRAAERALTDRLAAIYPHTGF